MENKKKCPKCGKEMSFYIEGNIAGSLGVFECECGYKNKNGLNIHYATDEDWERFHNNTSGIMW